MDKHFLRIDLIQPEHNFTLCRVVLINSASKKGKETVHIRCGNKLANLKS